MPNYSLDNMDDRAARARATHAAYIARLEACYKDRAARRADQKIPVVAFCGYGRAGKDTAAEFFCHRFSVVYPRSASWAALPVIATIAETDETTAWQERHDNWDFWIKACHAFRGPDYSLIARMCLGAGDVVVGIRGAEELACVVEQNVVDLTVWVDNPRVPVDKTVEYSRGDCDVVIDNHGPREDLYCHLGRLGRVLMKACMLS